MCIRDSVSSSGRTVLFVSHNLASISKLCNKALVLDKGKVVFYGDVFEGISHYNNQMSDEAVLTEKDYVGELYPQIKFAGIKVNQDEFIEGYEVDPFCNVEITIDIDAKDEVSRYRTQLSLYKDGQLISTLSDSDALTPIKPVSYTHLTLPTILLV